MKKQKPDYVRMAVKIVDKIIKVIKSELISKETKTNGKDTCGDSNFSDRGCNHDN